MERLPGGKGKSFRTSRPDISRQEHFDETLSRVCASLAPKRMADLVSAVRHAASSQDSRVALNDGARRANIWDDFSLAIAYDYTTTLITLEEQMRRVCLGALDALSPLERAILERCTEAYSDMMDPDELEPTTEERTRWLVDDLYRIV